MITFLAAAMALQAQNTLTPQETRQGFKLLFDGKSTAGWHNFKATGVGPGWTISDGALTSTDPGTAGDIVTDEKFDWFELLIDYKITPGGNSGIMYRCADDGDAIWHSGPEIQLYDNPSDPEVQQAGWLYQLYSSKVDATKPTGQWNTLRIIVAPKKCETYMNGVKYYEYVLGSDDFKARVAKSKFADMPQFGKLDKGTIGIQGDHGVVSFRNIKIRVIKP